MNRLLLLASLIATISGCMGAATRDGASSDFEKATRAEEISFWESRARSNLASIESALADYVKAENKIPAKLDELVPKYIAEIPSVDLPVCGSESNHVQNYGRQVLRDGVVDGSRLRGSGAWGYAHDDERVIVFIDCLKPSNAHVPWYQVRGVY